MSETENKKNDKIICHRVDLNKIPPEKLETLKKMNAISFDDSPIDSPLRAASAFIRTSNYPTAEQTKKYLTLNPPLNQIEDENGGSPLAYAVMYAQEVEVIKLLLEAGADINKKANNGWDIFMLGVARSQKPEVISYILTRFPKDKETLSKLLLIAAMNNKNIDIIKLLLDKGAEVNYKNEKGITSIRAALGQQSPEIIQLLLDHGANVNARDINGATPLMDAAATCENPKIFEILLNAGADPEMKDYKNNTALIYAAIWSSSGEVIDILDSVYPEQFNLNKALYMAAKNSTKSDVVGKLMDLGASFDFKDADGKTAYDWAQTNTNPEIRRQFENKLKFDNGSLGLPN